MIFTLKFAEKIIDGFTLQFNDTIQFTEMWLTFWGHQACTNVICKQPHWEQVLFRMAKYFTPKIVCTLQSWC